MRSAIHTAIVLIPLLCSPRGALPLIQKQSDAADTIKLRTDLVLLEAEVLSKKTGQALEGLRKEDFILYENGVKQRITHFSQDKLPLSVVILLDVSGSVWPYIKELREAALEALDQLKPGDEVALMVFAGSSRLVLKFTKDKRLIATNIGAVGGKELEGGTNPNEAVYQAATYLRGASSSDNRRVIVAITDDISTVRLPTPHTEQETAHELLESGGVVCGLFFDSIYRTRRDMQFDPLVPPASLINAAQDIVKSHVARTGGISGEVDKENVTAKFTQLIQRLRTRYSLGYVSSNEKLDGKFRRTRVTVSPDIEKKEKGIAVITRRGYYARKSGKSS